MLFTSVFLLLLVGSSMADPVGLVMKENKIDIFEGTPKLWHLYAEGCMENILHKLQDSSFTDLGLLQCLSESEVCTPAQMVQLIWCPTSQVSVSTGGEFGISGEDW